MTYRSTTTRHLAWPFVAAVFVLGSGCASVRQPDVPDAPSARPVTVSEPRPAEDTPSNVETAPRIEQELRAEVKRWEGTPHRWGGTDRSGVDCSGLVMVLYQDLFGLRLPRTTSEQVNAGEPVRPDELRTGDLVFFRPAKSQHVGIYLSNGEFAHASASRGVMVSNIHDRYWQNAYWTAQRVLPDEQRSSATEEKLRPRKPATERAGAGPATVATPQPETAVRAGW